jgi:hypothetical protein
MALKPGQQTMLTMSFMMHEGMEGPHDFRVYIPNNDPDHSNKELVVLSNWVQ